MKPFLVTLLLLNIALVQGQKNQIFTEKAIDDFSKFYQQNLKEKGVVGSNVWFFKDGKAMHKDYYGLANLEKDRPMDETAFFHWASITKPFTAQLDADIKEYIFKNFFLPFWGSE